MSGEKGKTVKFNGGLVVKGTLAAGGGTAIIHDNAQQGKDLSNVQIPSLIGRGRSGQTEVEISGEVVATNAQIDQDHAVAISYNNGCVNATENIEAGAEFYRRMQWPVENVVQFSEDLRKLAKPCNFSNPEKKLLEQFLYGVRFSEIRTKLQRKQELTFDRAIGVAEAMEEEILAPSEPIHSF